MLRSHFMADACGNPLTYCYSGLCLVTKQRGGIISAACRRYMMQPIYRQYPQVKARHHLLLGPRRDTGLCRAGWHREAGQ